MSRSAASRSMSCRFISIAWCSGIAFPDSCFRLPPRPAHGCGAGARETLHHVRGQGATHFARRSRNITAAQGGAYRHATGLGSHDWHAFARSAGLQVELLWLAPASLRRSSHSWRRCHRLVRAPGRHCFDVHRWALSHDEPHRLRAEGNRTHKGIHDESIRSVHARSRMKASSVAAR